MIDQEALKGYFMLSVMVGYFICLYSLGIIATMGISFVHLSIGISSKINVEEPRTYN